MDLYDSPLGRTGAFRIFLVPKMLMFIKGAGFYSLIAYGPVTFSPWVSVSLSVK